jgi:hypothetical protein
MAKLKAMMTLEIDRKKARGSMCQQANTIQNKMKKNPTAMILKNTMNEIKVVSRKSKNINNVRLKRLVDLAGISDGGSKQPHVFVDTINGSYEPNQVKRTVAFRSEDPY